MNRVGWVCILLAALAAGCSKKEAQSGDGNVNIQAPGVNVQAGPGGVSIQAPGVEVKAKP